LRGTAVAFAIVGNFEPALSCWRAQAKQKADADLVGFLMASAAGVLRLRLGLPLGECGDAAGQADSGVGDEAEVDFMESGVGLIWRALPLWLLLFGLANPVGG
jgi:adenosylcobinamide-phosphate synthase